MPPAKKQIRAAMRQLRQNLESMRRSMGSRQACNRMLASSLWQNAKAVALFVSLPEEISTWDLLFSAWREKKTVYLPRISPNISGEMDFCKCVSPAQLKKGRFGLLEPEHACLADEPFSADLMLVPGLAFDRTGNRVGYGGGYYDRYLGAHPLCAPICLGFAFAFQLLDVLPADEQDYKMSGICTDEELTIWSNI